MELVTANGGPLQRCSTLRLTEVLHYGHAGTNAGGGGPVVKEEMGQMWGGCNYRHQNTEPEEGGPGRAERQP